MKPNNPYAPPASTPSPVEQQQTQPQASWVLFYWTCLIGNIKCLAHARQLPFVVTSVITAVLLFQVAAPIGFVIWAFVEGWFHGVQLISSVLLLLLVFLPLVALVGQLVLTVVLKWASKKFNFQLLQDPPNQNPDPNRADD